MINETFQFFGPTFGGPFVATNASSPTSPNTTFGWTSFATPFAILARSDKEVDVHLGPVLKKAFLPLIGKLLNNQNDVTLTSGPFVQIAFWFQVPYFAQRLLSHSPTTMLLRVDFNLHIETPWWIISDADANISFYVFARLEGGHLKADVDGAWVTVNGGWPASQAIADNLGSAALQAIPKVQSAIDSTVAPFAGATFKTIYFIPGDGSKAEFLVQDATLDTTLAVVP
ncbi:MAG TPA: hypothetical protein VHA33_05760 [Candidatus Angelobacter sp.]|nr:hypothetical protein [Candidatus Angelobacter sp.]